MSTADDLAPVPGYEDVWPVSGGPRLGDVYAHLRAAPPSVEPTPDLSPLPRQHALLVDAAAVALSDLLRQSAERAPGLAPATRAMALRLAGSIRAAVQSYCGTVAAAAEAAGGEHV